ncbi:MAG: hypothetical protein JWQ55_2937 [Rhodopila sp.]|nr:hypothetical protein [Rhodopila sp.]
MTAASQPVGRFGPGLTRLILPRLPPAWAHVIRVVLGVWIALYLSYFLQLDSPYWAPTTVLLVAHPVRGALFSKSQWRILGTIVGAAGTVTLVAAFPQEPILFMASVSVWLGIFTFIASLLRYFRAYGAVLAGLTISLIAFGAVEHPETILNLALARIAAVTLGVLSAAFVSLIFHGSVGELEVERRVGFLMGAVASLLRSELQGQADRSPHSEQARISLDLAGVDEVIEFASAESFDISRRSTALRIGIAELFGALVAGSHTMPMMRDVAARLPGNHAAYDLGVAALNGALTQFVQHSGSPDAKTRGQLLRVALTARDELGTLVQDCTSDAHVMALAHARELLDRLSRAVQSIGMVRDEARPGPIRLRAYLDWRTALRNGLRAMSAMGLGSLFWIATAWPSGGSMLAMLGVMCSLLATNPSAGAASVDFAKGVVLSVLFAFVCAFEMLTHVDGFPLLALAILPFVAGGAYATTRPRLAPVGIPLLIFFMPLVGPTNPMHYDIVAFFNTAFAYVCGSICAVFAFRILLPPDPVLNVRRLCNSIGRAVERLGRPGPVQGRLQWEHLQHQKLARLLGRLQGASTPRREAVLKEASAAITVGSAAIQVRTALATGTLPAPILAAAEAAIHLLRDLRTNAAAAAVRSAEVSRLLAERSAGAPQSDELVRMAGAFQRIGTLIEQNWRFFQHPGASFQGDVQC